MNSTSCQLSNGLYSLALLISEEIAEITLWQPMWIYFFCEMEEDYYQCSYRLSVMLEVSGQVGRREVGCWQSLLLRHSHNTTDHFCVWHWLLGKSFIPNTVLYVPMYVATHINILFHAINNNLQWSSNCGERLYARLLTYTYHMGYWECRCITHFR